MLTENLRGPSGSEEVPNTMLTTDQFRARQAFFRFQRALDTLENEMKPLVQQMPIELLIELETLGKSARRFFTLANQELFATQEKPCASVHSSAE